VVVAALPVIVQFLIALLEAPLVAEVEAIHITAVVVEVFVFVIERLRSNPPLLLPSMVIKSAPFSTITAVVELPLILAVTPLAGRMVSVLVADMPANVEGMVIGKVSDAEL
jgi:hypothetical protein